MTESSNPPNETARLAALDALGVLDTPPEPRFDRLTRIAARALRVPTAALAFVDRERVFVKSLAGYRLDEAPRRTSFCDHTLLGPLVVPDAHLDPRFAGNPYVTSGQIRFYAGHPLLVGGECVGALCVVDPAPRELSADELGLLEDLARLAEEELLAQRSSLLLDELDRTRKRLENLLAAMPVGVVVYGLDLGLKYMNPEARRAVGLSEDAPLPALIEEVEGRLLDPETEQPFSAVTRPSARALRGEAVAGAEVLIRRPNAPDKVVSAATHLLTDPEGRPEGAVVVFHDVTERLEVEHMKRDFIALVSHELRTPLTAIYGALGLLTAGAVGELPPKAARMVGIAHASTERLVRLTNDMLVFERLRASRQPRCREPQDLAALAKAAAEAIEPLAAEAGVRLVLTLAHAPLEGDADQLVRAVTNLLSNAIKFSPAASEVYLAVTPTADGGARLVVEDTGRGIPADRLEAIFERFVQVDASDAREKAGTGLGLPIARAIVAHHGGRLWAERREPAGSRFVAAFPPPGA